MGILRISLFGGFRVQHEGRGAAENLTRAVQSFLAYLLLHRQLSHPRETLLGVFWGDLSEENARGCLNTTLWRLRQVLEPRGVARGTYLVSTAQGEIGFNSKSSYWLDVAEFEAAAQRLTDQSIANVSESEIRELSTALHRYTGEPLEGIFSDWALRERERLRAVYLKTLTRLMRYHQDHRAFENGLECGQKILVHDPLREEVHREMMRMYIASGQRSLAVRQYEQCRDILAAELDVEPMEETQGVYAQIARITRATGRPLDPTHGASTPTQPLLGALREAMQRIDETRERLRRAIRLAEHYTGNVETSRANPRTTRSRP